MMASPRVMAPAWSANADLARQHPIYPAAAHPAELRGHQARRNSLGSVNMEELLRHFYADSPTGEAAPAAEISPGPDAAGGEQDGEGAEGRESAEEVWKEFPRDRGVGGGGESVHRQAGLAEITLEAFLARTEVVAAEDVGAAPGAVQQPVDGPMLEFVVDPALGDRLVAQQQQQLLQVDRWRASSGNGGEGGKKRAVGEPLDKASQQKQRRMIRNRESAARSRDRKQAYTADLEKLVTKLEEENAGLVRQQEEQNKARLKQLTENLIPIDVKERPPCCLRRTCSMDW